MMQTFASNLRSLKRIADAPHSKANLLQARLSLMRTDRRSVNILGYHVSYPDAGSMRNLFEELFLRRVYDLPLSGTSPVIVDCGSNIGMSILRFKSQYPDSRIIAFEPHPELFETLQKNVQNNGLTYTELHRLAVGYAEEKLDMFMNDDDAGTRSLNASMIQRGGPRHLEVNSVRLSDYFPETVDLLKLDIEGAELLVLRDLVDRDRLKSAQYIICEYHHHITEGTDYLAELLTILETAGFGYQLSCYAEHPIRLGIYQDIMIYAYRKGTTQE